MGFAWFCGNKERSSMKRAWLGTTSWISFQDEVFIFLQGSWPALTINRQSSLQSFLGGEGHDCPRGREVSWTKLPGRWQEKWSFSHSEGKTSWFSSVYLDYLRGNSMVSWCFLCHLFLLQWSAAAGATDSSKVQQADDLHPKDRWWRGCGLVLVECSGG